jgi:hypothetical protein
MQNTLLSRFVLTFAIAAGAVAYASVAQAQMGGAFDPGTLMRQGVSQAPDRSKPATVVPPALPGATSRADTVAPATTIPTDMSPNDALFDAINRGDVGAARDAMNRGAELSAHNILGMTPLELSVDLGRNDISFLLMSYRGTDKSSTPPPLLAATAAKPGPAGKNAKSAAAVRTPPARVVPVKAVVPPAPPQTPSLFADDGGMPAPNDGFLGFGTGRAGH